MADELKPCPVCQMDGATDRYIRDGRQMFCPHCGWSAPCTFHGPDFEQRLADSWNTRTETRVQATIDELVAGLAAIVDGEIERPLGKRWREDKKPSKNDTCIHGVRMYEGCEGCIDAHVLAILSRHKGEGE